MTCESFEVDKYIKNLLKKFIKLDGLGDPNEHLVMFFLRHFYFHNNHRPLFFGFSRNLEGLTTQWYREQINPIQLRNFNMLIYG